MRGERGEEREGEAREERGGIGEKREKRGKGQRREGSRRRKEIGWGGERKEKRGEGNGRMGDANKGERIERIGKRIRKKTIRGLERESNKITMIVNNKNPVF